MNKRVPLIIPTQAQLVAASPTPQTTVKQLSDLAKRMIALEDEIAGIELMLKDRKETLRRMSQVDIPAALDEAGVKSITLPDGEVVEMEDFIAANIKKENEPAAFKWLRENKLGAVIKNELKVKFGKGEDAKVKKYVAFLKKLKVSFERKESVNWQTLQAFVKERLAAGKDLPPAIDVTKVPTVSIQRPEAKE